MKKKISMTFIAGVFSLALAAPGAMACSGAGPDKHIGNVTAVDVKASTVTIRDAETSNLLTFQAEAKLLSGIKTSDRVMIQFTEEDGHLVAVAIES